MPIFGHLNTIPIRMWDEARVAINAYEMLHNGNFIVTYFERMPDMWNTKPPLLIWIIVCLMKVIGVNELAVRLPSAIAAFITCIGILYFSLRYLKQFWFGFIAVMVLITTLGYVTVHSTRTGDYDSLMTMFTTLGALLFFSFIETKKNIFLYLFFIATALAVYTKSIQGLLFIPALAIYGIWQKQFFTVLKNKHFYIGLAGSMFLVACYYLLREYYNPGFIKAVWKNELGGRYLYVIENHTQGFWYYYHNIIKVQFKDWYIFVPLGTLVGLFHQDTRIKKLTGFAFLNALVFFLIISASKTKTEWYDVPIYPFIAILVAVFINYVFDLIINFEWFKKTLRTNIAPYVFLFLMFFFPYQKIFDKTYNPKKYDSKFFDLGYYLKDAIKGNQYVDGYFIIFSDYNAHLDFYVKILKEKGVNVSFKNQKNLEIGDVIIVQHIVDKINIESNYVTETISETGSVVKLKIVEKKSKKG
jgi:4-amino-4-deoxy-L-arabinose transferase-like glycosyltransferase